MSDSFRVATEIDVSRGTDPATLISFDFVASASFQLPGLSASMEHFGAGFEFRLNLAGDSSLGYLHLATVPKLPTGMAAELNLGPVTGGGYLSKTDAELRGAFSANLGLINVTALGVLGLSEFSMLVLMAAEFEPPIQLSFGFTLVAVGGLVGINRRADEDALTAATASGDLSRLMFPRDPIAEAPHLLDVASRCFPFAPDGILIGPMIKIGWGTPTMISATLAVIVSTADGKAIIIGRFALTLPAEQAPLIFLQAVIKGDVDQNGIRIDASLADSRIIFMQVGGDIRLRMITGPNPLFAVSAGGFYPGFPVPEGMAGMRRLSVDLSSSPVLRLRAEAYLAITTSSLQFGARVELQAGFDGFGIHGFAEFDAFINTEPFGFGARLQASISVECADFDVASISLDGSLGGPAKWHITGHASIEVLFFDVDIDLPELSWGPDPPGSTVPRDPLAVLVDALATASNWSASSAAVPQLVTLRAGPGAHMLIHPLSGISFRQHSIPIETELARVDGVALGQPATLHVAVADAEVQPVSDEFVPDQFFAQDDNARLTQSGYAALPGGFDIIPHGILAEPTPIARLCDYEILELHSEGIWRRWAGVLEQEGLVHGLRARPIEVQVPLVKPRDPRRELADAAGFDLSNAAGLQLAAAPAWELQ